MKSWSAFLVPWACPWLVPRAIIRPRLRAWSAAPPSAGAVEEELASSLELAEPPAAEEVPVASSGERRRGEGLFAHPPGETLVRVEQDEIELLEVGGAPPLRMVLKALRPRK